MEGSNLASMDPSDVSDFQTFVRFVRWLAADRIEEIEKERLSPSHPMDAGANGWQNGSIEAFLDAAAACGEDNFQLTGYEPVPSWQEFARFLAGGKSYE